MSGVFPARRPGRCRHPHCEQPVIKRGDLVAYDRNVLMHHDCASRAALGRTPNRAEIATHSLLRDLAALPARGWDVTVTFTQAGVTAELSRDGQRVWSTPVCGDVQSAGEQALCWIEAQQ